MLSEMKVPELKALAKEKGIKGSDGMTKPALLIALSEFSEDPVKGETISLDEKPKEVDSANRIPGKYLKFQK